MSQNGKGDRSRIGNHKKYANNWDEVYKRNNGKKRTLPVWQEYLLYVAILAALALSQIGCGAGLTMQVWGVPFYDCHAPQLTEKQAECAIEAVANVADLEFWEPAVHRVEVECRNFEYRVKNGRRLGQYEHGSKRITLWWSGSAGMVLTHELVHWLQDYDGALSKLPNAHVMPWFDVEGGTCVPDSGSICGAAQREYLWCMNGP